MKNNTEINRHYRFSIRLFKVHSRWRQLLPNFSEQHLRFEARTDFRRSVTCSLKEEELDPFPASSSCFVLFPLREAVQFWNVVLLRWINAAYFLTTGISAQLRVWAVQKDNYLLGYCFHQLHHILEIWVTNVHSSSRGSHCVFLQYKQANNRYIMQSSLHQNKAIIEMDIDVTEQFIFLKRVLLYKRS